MKVTLEEFSSLLSEVIGRTIADLKVTNSPIDIEGWDSLNHVYLIIKLESFYKVKFNTSQIQKWKNIGDILNDINTLIS